MLLIITPNPALDRTMVIRGMRAGAVLRAERVLVRAGGKGLNVARAAGTLGLAARVCAPLGGQTGVQVARLAAEEGLVGHWSWHTAGETRTCVLVVDPDGEDATALNEHGPELRAEDWRHFSELVVEQANECRLAAICGSLPPGVAPVQLAELIERLQDAGRPILVDSSGPALQAALAARPYGLKVNATELGALLGRPIGEVSAAAAALHQLCSQGLHLAAVSLGRLGALASDGNAIWWARPPEVTIVSSVGSGDSLLAGIAAGLLHGDELAAALRLGVACGTADALTIGGGLIERDTVDRLVEQVALERL